MHSQLTVMAAQSHQYDLQRAAERWNAAGRSRRSFRRFGISSPLKAILNGRRLSVSQTRALASH